MKKIKLLLMLLASLFVINASAIDHGAVEVKGETKQWHKISLLCGGPDASETAATFLNYRLQVTFTKGALKYSVPGYFAADGNAGESGATSGNVWKCHFNAPTTGTWNYSISFLKGENAAISDGTVGTAESSLDGKSGSFEVSATDKTGRDMRAKGRLEYVGEHHLQFAGSKEYFIKAGPDSPENLLAFKDIDNTGVGGKADYMKDWAAHVQDWNIGDPTWQNGKGKGLIGAINYLASEGMNSISFLTMNTPLGDDKNVCMWTGKNEQTSYDCSKCDQWEVIFSHAQAKGLYLHFKTQETENELVLDNGDLGTERKLYYRELIARFGHHNALNWNICEEGGAGFSSTNQTPEQRKASIAYFADNDPYSSNVVLHTAPNLNNQKKIYENLLGNGSKLTGLSLQNEWDDAFECTHHWVTASANAGRKWVVANDEQGKAQLGVPHDDYTGSIDLHSIRKKTLWGNLMAGGAGVEYYFGYGDKIDGDGHVDIIFDHSDMRCQDFRTRDKSWDFARHALSFFDLYIPFWEMSNDDSKTSNSSHCLLKEGEVYVVYLENGGSTNLSLAAGTYNVDWFNAKEGGVLIEGTRNLAGGGSQSIGTAPSNSDWVALVRNTNFTHSRQVGNGFEEPDPTKVSTVSVAPLETLIEEIGNQTQLRATVGPTTAINKAVTWRSGNLSVATVDDNGMVTAVSKGIAKIYATTVEGEKVAFSTVTVGVNEVNTENYTIGDDYIVFEAEVAANIPANWKIRTPEYAQYILGTSGVKPINDTYIEYMGGNEGGVGVATGQDVLTYKFTPKTDGAYRVTGRMAQNQNGAAWDKCNDVYVKMEGDFTSGNAATVAELQSWSKFYGRGLEDWGAFVKGEPHHGTMYPFIYNLKGGQEYTFSVSGRSQRVCIDYWLFCKTSLNLVVTEKKCLAANNPEQYRPGACSNCISTPVCQEIKAINFDKYTGITGFVDAKTDKKSGKDVLQVSNALKTAAAQFTYMGADAEVYFTLNTMLEGDGECPYTLKVNDIEVGTVTNKRIHGTDIADYTIEEHLVNEGKYPLKSGDLIQVEFTNATNKLVPEEGSPADGFATARARWYSLDICTEKQGETGNENPNAGNDDIVNHTLPTTIAMNGKATFSISYNASEDRDIIIELKDITDAAAKFQVGNISVSAPAKEEGVVNVNFEKHADKTLSKTQTYEWVMYMVPKGGSWKETLSNGGKPIKVKTVASEEASSLKALTSKDIRVYPTPFSNTLTIESTETLSNILLVNMTGSILKKKKVNNVMSSISTEDVPRGMYLLQLNSTQGTSITQKVIK